MQHAIVKFKRINTNLRKDKKTLNAETLNYIKEFTDTSFISNHHYYIIFTNNYIRF